MVSDWFILICVRLIFVPPDSEPCYTANVTLPAIDFNHEEFFLG